MRLSPVCQLLCLFLLLLALPTLDPRTAAATTATAQPRHDIPFPDNPGSDAIISPQAYHQLIKPAGPTTDPHLIVYTAALIFDGILDVERGGIFVMRPDGTGARQLTSFQTLNFDFAQHGLNLPDDHPSVSPDGKLVAFTSNREDRNNWEIYIMEINGANPRRLTNNPGLDTEPTWSPDGQRLAFASARNGQKFNIWTMDSKNGANLQQVTTNAAEDLEPAFSPDGSRIAFSRIVGDHEKDVFLINTDGTGEAILRQQPGEDHDPTWSPDGTEVVITSEIAGTDPFGDSWRVRVADGTYLQNITTNLPHGGGDPAWSPDGSQVVLFASATALLQSPMKLWRVNADGTNAFEFERTGFLNVHPNWGLAVDTDGDGVPNYMEQANRSFNEANFTGEPEPDNHMGTALALADFNHDGNLDLFIGVPGQTEGGLISKKENAGKVLVAPSFPLAGLVPLPPVLFPVQLFKPGGDETNANFGKAMVGCDFNGDGFRDVAIAAVGFNQVSIYTGINQIQNLTIAAGSLGGGMAAGDFNKDGKCDLAAGASNQTRGGFTAGAVHVYFGNSSGVSAAPLTIDQSLISYSGDAGKLENLDSFGATLAAGDLNGDGAAELVIAALNEDYGGIVDAGLVHIIPGSPSGLLLQQAESVDIRNLPAPNNVLQTTARFGESIAIGNFTGNAAGVNDLVIAAPGQDVGGVADAGLLAVFKGKSSSGLVEPTASKVINVTNLGTNLSPARLGQSMVVGDFSGDNIADLAVSAPLIGAPGNAEHGVVYLILGSKGSGSSRTNCSKLCGIAPLIGSTAAGLQTGTAQKLDSFVMGQVNPAPGDHFGAALTIRSTQPLAAGDIDEDGQDDLLIGIPDRNGGGQNNAGAISVRYGVKVGISVLTPTTTTLQAGEPITFTLDWTHPNNWHDLDQLHLRLRNAEGEVGFWARFDEATASFLLHDPATDTFVSVGEGATLLETALATLDLTRSQVIGSGPEGRAVRVIFAVQPKSGLAGDLYQIELLASDDNGNSQGFDPAGEVAIGPFSLWLPVVTK